MKERVEKCPKCGTNRDNFRWPAEICLKREVVQAPGTATGFAFENERLVVTCGRCQFSWRELPADAEANDLKEMVEAAS